MKKRVVKKCVCLMAVFILVGGLTMVFGCANPVPVIPARDSMALVWSDEFEQSSQAPDTSKWTYDIGNGDWGWGNQEVQYYTNDRTNSWVDNGTLKIKATKVDGQYRSAKLLTRGIQTWTYGYFEIKARLPMQKGTWPAFWMMPKTNTYGIWPASGEIDIMEHAPSTTGANMVYGTTHTKDYYGGSGRGTGKFFVDNVNDWHVYAVEWTDKEIRWFVDDKIKGSLGAVSDTAKWPFKHDFYLILNLAVGGTLGGSITSDWTEALMEIDYVRVYQ